MKTEYDQNDVDMDGRWEIIDTYTARCYGGNGDEPGDVPVAVRPCEVRGSDDDVTMWAAAEIPDECTNYIGIYTDRDEAVAAAEAFCAEHDHG
jgi:hypothetical protein